MNDNAQQFETRHYAFAGKRLTGDALQFALYPVLADGKLGRQMLFDITRKSGLNDLLLGYVYAIPTNDRGTDGLTIKTGEATRLEQYECEAERLRWSAATRAAETQLAADKRAGQLADADGTLGNMTLGQARDMITRARTFKERLALEALFLAVISGGRP